MRNENVSREIQQQLLVKLTFKNVTYINLALNIELAQLLCFVFLITTEVNMIDEITKAVNLITAKVKNTCSQSVFVLTKKRKRGNNGAPEKEVKGLGPPGFREGVPYVINPPVFGRSIL